MSYVLICHNWPGWALGLQARGWAIQVRLVKDEFCFSRELRHSLAHNMRNG
jgi:hypothetical protein